MKKNICLKLFFYFLGLFFISGSHAFDMFISTGYTGAPDFSKYGFKSAQVIYEQQIFNHGEDRGVISPLHINKVASLIKNRSSDIVILDIEYWMKGWRQHDRTTKVKIMNKYVATVNKLHSKFPDHKFGYYGIVPAWLHWDISRSQQIYNNWEKENHLRNIVSGAVDVFCPSIYTYNTDPEDWKVRATLAVSKAREMANGKKVIPFIWPGYHQSSKARRHGVKRLPAKYWRFQLEHIKTIADGFIIWDGALGSNGAWNDEMPWWLETKKFLDDHFPKKQLEYMNQSK